MTYYKTRDERNISAISACTLTGLIMRQTLIVLDWIHIFLQDCLNFQGISIIKLSLVVAHY